MAEKNANHATIADLGAHPRAYVTVRELADYWMVGRKQVYKQIKAGMLPAIRLGDKLVRVRTIDALEFELRARTAGRVTSGPPWPALVDG